HRLASSYCEIIDGPGCGPAEMGLGMTHSLALRGGSLELASEEVGPVGDIRVATQQGAALTLRHATPDTELHLVIEGIGAALQNDGAVTADKIGRASCRERG